MAINLSFIKTTKNGLILTIYVHPKSKSHINFKDNSIELWVKAPAEGGKANKEAIKSLADTLKLSSSKLHIIEGLRSRRKLIFIDSQNPLKIKEKIKDKIKSATSKQD